MPVLYFKYISCTTLDVSFKINFFSWFKRRNVFVEYKNKLSSLVNKNKQLYLIFYNYLFFKQLAGLKVFNILNNFYLVNAISLFSEYSYSYIDLTFTELATNLYINSSTTIISLQKNRNSFFKNLLNVNFKTNKFNKGHTQYFLYDFNVARPAIIFKWLLKNYNTIFKSFNLLLFKYKILQQNQTYCFFFFKLFCKILKRILFLKYLYYFFIFRFSNNSSFRTLSRLRVNSKFIFDFFFLFYSNYFLLLKMLIIFFKFNKFNN